MAAAVELTGLTKVYPGGVQALAAVDLRAEPAEFLTLVGRSGSGKSTLLRMVAGLESATAGRVQIGDVDVTGLAPRDRGVAMVFQNPALYPHLSVLDNLAFGLRARGAGRAESRRRAEEVASVLGLGGMLARRPATLSGGERQRVALGRALATRPKVFLLDEPLSALDPPLRAALREELRALHRLSGSTFLHVTHDQSEALALGERIGVLQGGRLLQVGTPRSLYERPATREVGVFLGSPPMSVLRCEVVDGPRLVFPGRPDPEGIPLRGLRPGLTTGRPVDLGLRPEHVVPRPAGEAASAGLSPLPGALDVTRVEYQGHECLAELALGSGVLAARFAPGSPLRAGDRVAVGLDLARASWFDPVSGLAL